MEIVQTDTPARRAGEILTEKLKANNGKDTLLLLSGGSAFNLLEYVRVYVLGPHVTIGMLDERFDIDPKVNNFSQFKQNSFYAICADAGCRFIDTSVHEGESLADYVGRFKSGIESNANKSIIVTMGMGPDGHTAGIMPFSEDYEDFKELFEKDALAVGYDVGDKNTYPLRVTVTNTFLREKVDGVVMFISGNNKQEAFDSMLISKQDIYEIPARIIHDMEQATIVTDLVE